MTEVERYKRRWVFRRRARILKSGAIALSGILLVALVLRVLLEVDQMFGGDERRGWITVVVVVVSTVLVLVVAAREMRAPLVETASTATTASTNEWSDAASVAVNDLGAQTPWPENVSILPLHRMTGLVRGRQWEQALQAAAEFKRRWPKNALMTWLEADANLGAGNCAEAEAIYQELLDIGELRSETRFVFQMALVNTLTLAGRIDELQRRLDRVLAEDWPVGLKAALLDQLATQVVFKRRPNLLELALKWASAGMELCPDRITLRGTYASVLCENNRWDEAEPILREVLDKSPALVDQGISAAYLARLCHRRGDLRGAKDWLVYSRYVFPDKALESRLRQELPDLF